MRFSPANQRVQANKMRMSSLRTQFMKMLSHPGPLVAAARWVLLFGALLLLSRLAIFLADNIWLIVIAGMQP